MARSACLAVIVAFALSVAAHATSEYFKVFSETYKDTPAPKNGCINCHQDRPPIRNPYGRAVDDLVMGGKLTPAMLHQLDNLDSDGDGYTNIEEIKAGSLPGYASSHPASHVPGAPLVGTPPPGAMVGVPGQTPSASPQTFDLLKIPPHSEHPAVVHFPVALFLFGAFLELLGRWKNKPELGIAAVWNLWFGFLGGIVALATGLIASYRLGYGLPPTGPALPHMIAALIAFALMGLTLAMRPRRLKAYLPILIAAALAVAVTGYLGGLTAFGS
jgi:uncharacterized membrane protein